MGRKAKFDETNVPSGRGKKAKKQGDPIFPKGVLGMENYKFINMYVCQLQMYLLFYLKIKKKRKYIIQLLFLVKEEKKLSHRQKQRAKKRLLKKQNIKEKLKELQKEKIEKLKNIIDENVSFFFF